MNTRTLLSRIAPGPSGSHRKNFAAVVHSPPGGGGLPLYQGSLVCSSNGRVSAGGGTWCGRIGSVRSPFHGT